MKLKIPKNSRPKKFQTYKKDTATTNNTFQANAPFTLQINGLVSMF